ncbi:hypothetical protein LWV78_002613 [Salmonella enterica]|uniref:Uncharacterized protein n=1 Tax=Salmonella enterica TaxID=28901 RepID=A0A5V0Q915_SALER|nr:hypothetical protein [Salmonella enterica]ECO0979260.1 hypothetical protein [Salmonella enterica subsp. enterica serovar Muenchen]ECS6609553.1 hypothetical protein [Salmonella enterica subsp. enterica serovar Give]ECX5677774.1 hypothetical protein [Salmonella enterica subsp. enterica serovar Newport]ECZ7727194.1 hypothetical protein [Salmonella enterica subsp. enterica serovar Rubislaw]EDT7011675.1 hypothetical protein [Salmonella enterica subsp. enterica serovar Abaetetuba]EDX4384562.1 hy
MDEKQVKRPVSPAGDGPEHFGLENLIHSPKRRKRSQGSRPPSVKQRGDASQPWYMYKPDE